MKRTLSAEELKRQTKPWNVSKQWRSESVGRTSTVVHSSYSLGRQFPLMWWCWLGQRPLGLTTYWISHNKTTGTVLTIFNFRSGFVWQSHSEANPPSMSEPDVDSRVFHHLEPPQDFSSPHCEKRSTQLHSPGIVHITGKTWRSSVFFSCWGMLGPPGPTVLDFVEKTKMFLFLCWSKLLQWTTKKDDVIKQKNHVDHLIVSISSILIENYWAN